MTVAELVLGRRNPDQRRSAALLMWPLFFIAAARFAYGVDSLIHGSPQMTLLGGAAFSTAWSICSAAGAILALVGLLVTVREGRSHLELIGCAACCALSIGFAFGVVWNVATPSIPQGSLVPAWQPLGLGLVAGWRAHRIGGGLRRGEHQ